jgi:hypothetical protein
MAYSSVPSDFDYYSSQYSNNTNNNSNSNTNNSNTYYSSDNNSSNVVDYDNEPPLLEELGINPSEIFHKSLSVAIPFDYFNKLSSAELSESESDLAGPLLICLLFGTFLMLGGKLHFGYIYGKQHSHTNSSNVTSATSY